jgi:hypothetical protein
MNTTFDIDGCIDAFHRGATEQLAQYLDDDFTFDGPTPQPLPAEGFLGLIRLLFTAFPDLDWHLSVSDATDDGFLVTTRTAGTHTGPFDLSALGLGMFTPTDRSFALPNQSFRWTHRDGKVTRIQAQPAEGVGVPGMLAQLRLVPASS